MTLYEAITALLDDYGLEDAVEMIRDEVRGDPEFARLSAEGMLSGDHPKVQRYKECCRTLREAVKVPV